MRRFNTTGVCVPQKHYMVDLSERVAQIKKMVDAGKYFTINRARQYGKTTTLNELRKGLSDEYDVVSLDFQAIGNASFESEQTFVKAFCRQLKRRPSVYRLIPDAVKEQLEAYLAREKGEAALDELAIACSEWCSLAAKPVVLIIDEVDTATNNQVFLDFLAQLRDGYIVRDTDDIPTFQSVILAGVTDVRHLKAKIRLEDQHRLNSPWNIAADFNIDMSLPEAGIRGMLKEYEADHCAGMDTAAIARQIREYTGGYPYLVSRICETIDTILLPGGFGGPSGPWTAYGVDEAVKRILSEDNALFESLMGKLENYPKLKDQLRMILFKGAAIAYMPDDEEQKQLRMFGFIVNNHNKVAIANRVFEMRLYQHFVGENNKNEGLRQLAIDNRSIFVDENGWLNVPKIMDHFILEHNRIHGKGSQRFLEEEGRERFITYVSAIINGTGTYSVEEQTRDHRRMDLVIHYLGRRYVVEMKIWHGERYNASGEQQIAEYLDYFGLTTGYLLSFSFSKNKKPGVELVRVGDKLLYEGIV